MNERSFGGARASTHWSLLLGRGELESRAWEHFHERYRGAVAALFARKGVPPHEIDELVQDFFATAFERGLLEAADPARGRFRGYLRTAAERYLISVWRHAGRARRRPEGGVAALPDEALLAASGELSPGDAFDLAWAQSLLAGAIDRTRRALVERGNGDHFESFRLRTYEELSWDEIAARLGTTPEAARKRAGRVEERISVNLRQEVADTVPDAAELEVELAELAGIIGDRA